MTITATTGGAMVSIRAKRLPVALVGLQAVAAPASGPALGPRPTKVLATVSSFLYNS